MSDKREAIQSDGATGRREVRSRGHDGGMGRLTAIKCTEAFDSGESPPLLGEPSRRNRIIDDGTNAGGGQR